MTHRKRLLGAASAPPAAGGALGAASTGGAAPAASPGAGSCAAADDVWKPIVPSTISNNIRPLDTTQIRFDMNSPFDNGQHSPENVALKVVFKTSERDRFIHQHEPYS